MIDMDKANFATLKKSKKDQIKLGDTAYLVHSNRFIREVTVTRIDGYGMYSVRFADAAGGIRVRINRLFQTKEEAEHQMSALRHITFPA